MIKKVWQNIRSIHHWPKKYLVLSVIILTAIIWFIFPKGSNTPVYEYTEAKPAQLQNKVSASGVINGKNSVNLRFVGGGKLASINVKVGDQIQQGELLASLDTQAMAINLQQAKNNLRSSQATVDKIIDDIHQFQYGNGGFGNVGTSNETAGQRQARMAAEATRDNAVDSLKAAQRVYQDNQIYSPIAGIVTQANPLPGQVVSPTDIVVQVVDFTEINFEADVDEADINRIQVGQKVYVTLNAYEDQTFAGMVTEIKPSTRTTTNGATVISVKINLADQNIHAVAGLNGQAEIITDQKDVAITIPLEALRADNTVLVKRGDKTEVIKVDTGFTSDSQIEITSGLQAGDQVVTNPVQP